MVVRDFKTVITKEYSHSAFAPVVSAKAPGNEPEIDYDRVIWDLDYRRHVVDELNRFHRSGSDRRDGHVAL